MVDSKPFHTTPKNTKKILQSKPVKIENGSI